MKPTSKAKIALSGVGGFIGSHIGQALVAAGYPIVGLKRENSDLARCASYQQKVAWIEFDKVGWQEELAAHKPYAMIHCAWGGVTATERFDWKLQFANLKLLTESLHYAATVGLQRFISFGSQAEYGPICGRVNEEHPCWPNTAYGTTKLASLALLEGCARQVDFNYLWLRLFSVYGPGEGAQWFIPGLIRQFRAGTAPQLTTCEQRYDYLHVRDLAAAVLSALDQPEHRGVFHLTSNSSIRLRDIVELIQQYTGTKVEPHFGALPQRPGQSMHLEGDSTLFYRTFGFQPKVSLQQGLRELVEQTPE